MKKEIWKDIPGYEGIYKISDLGRIKSFKFGREKIWLGSGRKYRQFFLTKNHKQIPKKIHRLVMLAFKGPSELPVDHINGDTLDNRLVNLEYVTTQENVLRGRVCSTRGGQGSSKLRGAHRYNDKWVARIYYEGKTRHLGTFDSPEEAHSCYIEFKKNKNLLRDNYGDKNELQN